jgi:hypothetical protein
LLPRAEQHIDRMIPIFSFDIVCIAETMQNKNEISKATLCALKLCFCSRPNGVCAGNFRNGSAESMQKRTNDQKNVN